MNFNKNSKKFSNYQYPTWQKVLKCGLIYMRQVMLPYAQLLANYLSVSIGNNSDTPEGLTKVCETI